MSKGGAGKVYFVLYLAVILELLIIFIERDEAEENLRKQQRRALEIVQTILAQLSTGAGTSGITASPKDNITLSQKEQENIRQYDVTVSVGDTNQSRGTSSDQSEVARLDYIVSHISDASKEEKDLSDDSLDLDGEGSRIFSAALGTKMPGKYDQPSEVVARGGIPTSATDKYFFYNQEKTDSALARGRRVKIFSVDFKPNAGPGWYRLRFQSLTNKILGVTRDQPGDADTVRIGNIRLTVKQLREVRKVLRSAGSSSGADKATTTKVQGYIDSLLAKDAYLNLPENKGYTSFNVHVVRPDIPPPSAPAFAWQGVPVNDTIYWYAGKQPVKVAAVASPPEQTPSFGGGSATKTAPGQYTVSFNAENPTPEGTAVPVAGSTQNARGERATDQFFIVAYAPTLNAPRKDRPAIDQWRGRSATVGSPYNPSTQWTADRIPASHYQTRVWINDQIKLNSSGTDFNKTLSQEQRNQLLVPDGARIKTVVYWKPGGTSDESEWVPLLSTDPSIPAPFSTSISIKYPSVEAVGLEPEYTWIIASKELSGAGSLTYTSGPFSAQLPLGAGRMVPAMVTLGACDGCEDLRATADVTGTESYSVVVSAPKATLSALNKKKDLNGRRITVRMKARAPKGDESEIATDVVILVR